MGLEGLILSTNIFILVFYIRNFIYVNFCLTSQTEDHDSAIDVLRSDLLNRVVLLNVEYRVNGVPHVTLLDAETKVDLVKNIVEEGYLLVDKRNDRRLAKVVSDVLIHCINVFYHMLIASEVSCLNDV